MRRRKYIAAMGSLAAGGAAALGTGAVSQFQSGDRSIRAEKVGDKAAYVALQKPPTNGGNTSGRSDPTEPDGQTRHGNFVEFTGSPNATLELDFGQQSSARSGNPQGGNSLGGSGVNPGSTYYFDGTFVIRNLGNNTGGGVGELEAWIEESIDGITFYKGSAEGNRVRLDEKNPLKSISPGSAKAVGVKIVADELKTGTNSEVNSSFEVYAENPNNDA
jgi:hypothetical protein